MINGTLTYAGYCVDLLNDIQEILGFEYTIYEAPDGVYGRMDENMNWNGMIKELIDKVSTLAIYLHRGSDARSESNNQLNRRNNI